MANVLVSETYLTNIASAIRYQNGTANTYKPGEMAQAIKDIPLAIGDGEYTFTDANNDGNIVITETI